MKTVLVHSQCHPLTEYFQVSQVARVDLQSYNQWKNEWINQFLSAWGKAHSNKNIYQEKRTTDYRKSL